MRHRALGRTMFAVITYLVSTMGMFARGQENAEGQANLPRVLLLGDSISIGYTPYVQEMMKGDAVVIRPTRGGQPENCSGTTHGIANIDRWLALDGGAWDVIHFNFGLHDLKREDPQTHKASPNPEHPRQADLETYERQLRQIVTKLKATGAAVIFATTTPVPEGKQSPYRGTEDPPRYNEVAKRIMGENGVAIDDLYAFALPRLGEIQRPANVHFTAEGSKQLAEQVVKHVRAVLKERSGKETKNEPQTRAGRRPNILFILSDDQRADLLGCAGHPILKTPNIDRLARDGVRFENMFVTTSICAATRATILTGLVERSHKYTFGTPPIAAPFCEDSYPAVLKAAGYRTGFVGKFGVGVPSGEQEAMFDVFHPLNRTPYFKKQPDGSLKYVEEIAGDLAIGFLNDQPADRPFCLSISFNAPHAEDNDKEDHYPWPPSVDGMYEDLTIPPPRLSDPAIFEAMPAFLKESMNRDRWFWRWDTPEKYQKNVKAYFRMISGIDTIIGRVLGELGRLGLDENTVVVFSGDNGYYLASRGFAGKWTHFEESQRVPLIVMDPRVPGSLRGRVRSEMVLNLDIAPTIVDFAGVPVPDRYQGRSLVPLVESDAPAPSDWRTDFFCEHLFDNPDIPKWEGVRGQRYKYARYFQQDPPYEFLHDLDTDPDELKNFTDNPNYADILERLRQRCDDLRDQYGGPYSKEAFPTVNRR